MLYYLLSNNFINKIINAINTDFILNDDDFLSFYVNFLKSISLKLDLTTLHFFFLIILKLFFIFIILILR